MDQVLTKNGVNGVVRAPLVGKHCSKPCRRSPCVTGVCVMSTLMSQRSSGGGGQMEVRGGGSAEFYYCSKSTWTGVTHVLK